MRLTPTTSSAPLTPVYLQVACTAADTYEAYEAAAPDVELGGGVHRMTYEAGLLVQRGPGAPWTTDRRRIVALDDDGGALDVAAAAYEAYAGFLALGITPGDHRAGAPGVDVVTPGMLSIRADDATWRFDAASAPTAAVALLQAARAMRDL